jgi:phage baseplate assembly protein gpV
LANSTNFYIGNGTKFTVFDGAGNQINKGSSITVGTEYSNVYIDNYTVEINSDNSKTLVNTSIASFSGNVVIVGPLSTNGTYGQAGDVLYSSGEASYWAQPASITDFIDPIVFSNTANFNDGATFNGGLTVEGSPVRIYYFDRISDIEIYNTSTYSHDALTINTTTDLENYESVTLSPNTLQMVANNAAFQIGNSTVNTTVNSTAISVSGNVIISNTIVANNSGGSGGQVLTANGVGGIYWATPVNSVFDGGTPFSTYTDSPRLDAGGVY